MSFVTNEEQRTRMQKWRSANSERVSAYKKNYYKSSEHQRIKNLTAVKVRHAILGVNKKDISHITGCSNERLMSHLENQFDSRMSWKNYGKYGWHIDHKKPCASFDLTKESEFKKCFHFTNLQPLWCDDNYKKFTRNKDKV